MFALRDMLCTREQRLPFLNGLLSQRISDRLYGALALCKSDFAVVQLPSRQRRSNTVYRVCVGPLSLLNAGCDKHARVLCRDGRRAGTLWRAAQLLPGGYLSQEQLLTRYGDEGTVWRCPAAGCTATFKG